MSSTCLAPIFQQADPWGLETLWYEARKRDILMATLPERHYASVLEVGCATGVLTARLAARCGALLAVDLVPRAIDRTRDRVADQCHVEARVAKLPAEWPAGCFDLIVLSELGYYFTREDWQHTATLAANALSANGTLVACHWLHPFDGRTMSTRHVHSAIADQRGLHRHVRHVEPDFLLEVWSRNAQPLRAREPLQ